jgi:predicted MPP superfamily phosphohydrolase
VVVTFGLGGILLIVAMCLSAYALLIEPLLCQLVRVDIPVEALPEGTRILFLTDMHHHRWGKREESYLRCLPPDPVDLIVYGGDFLGSRAGIDAALQFVTQVREMYPNTPTFGVCGNAEHKLFPNVRETFLAQLHDVGVITLENAHVECRVNGVDVAIVGTDDPYYGFHDLQAAFSNVKPGMTTLLVTHSPQVVRSAMSFEPALMLSGHTHGGQVRIPGIGPIRTQNPLSRTIAMGMFSPDDLARLLQMTTDSFTWLYVSRGLGLAFVPHVRWLAPRFLCRPEVTLITISR